MKQAELALKEAEQQRKAQKDFVDAALKNEKIEADKAIAGAKLGVELAKEEKNTELEGIKLGSEIVKNMNKGS